jgi:hypothetical protein
MRAFNLGRIMIVDEKCRLAAEKAGAAVATVIATLERPNPQNLVLAELFDKDVSNAVPELRSTVDKLVAVAASRLGPVRSVLAPLEAFERSWGFGDWLAGGLDSFHLTPPQTRKSILWLSDSDRWHLQPQCVGP